MFVRLLFRATPAPPSVGSASSRLLNSIACTSAWLRELARHPTFPISGRVPTYHQFDELLAAGHLISGIEHRLGVSPQPGGKGSIGGVSRLALTTFSQCSHCLGQDPCRRAWAHVAGSPQPSLASTATTARTTVSFGCFSTTATPPLARRLAGVVAPPHKFPINVGR